LTRQGLEEYVSDCVILLDHQVTETVLTRRLRVVKYRGSTHGMNEYPFLIENDGISVLPVTSIGYVLVALVGRIFLHEQVSVARWAGIVLIVVGVALVGRTAPRTTVRPAPVPQSNEAGS
jgi:hypothetical protein